MTQAISAIPSVDSLQSDPALWQAVKAEAQRQQTHIELIASENFASPAVLAAQGSVLTNKYAEGYPGKRYYGGCEHVDTVERLAIARACQLFGAHYANVQPHSGSQANAAVFLALLSAGDTVLGMDLKHGGHLTHGCPVNFSGRLYHSVTYGLHPETGDIDYEQVEKLAKTHRPRLIIAGFSAFSGIVDWQRFRDIADEVGAWLLADMAHVAGLVAVGLYPSPVGIADVVTSTTHKTLRGPRGGLILAGRDKDREGTLVKQLNSGIFPGSQGGPLMHVIAAKAVAFHEAMQPDFTVYQQRVLDNAHAMVTAFLSAGMSVVSDGTQNHLFLLDLREEGVSGKVAEQWLEKANITLNKNTVPGDTRSPFETSGLRIGTPAMTTRGLGVQQMQEVAQWIVQIIRAKGADVAVEKVKCAVLELCARFPLYQAND